MTEVGLGYCWVGNMGFIILFKMNSFVKGDNDRLKTLQKGHLKGMKEMEAISRYRESVFKKKRKIEWLYEQSISNQIYIFPRGKTIASISS